MLIDHIPDCAQRLPCSDAEKDACLSTVTELLNLWRVVRKDGVLAVGGPYADQVRDPFYRACLQDAGEWMGTDKEPLLEHLFAQYLLAGDYRGGDFLHNVVATEGVLAFLQTFQRGEPSFEGWGERLAAAVQGYFGADYREKVRTAIRREIHRQRREAAKTSFLPEFDALAELPPPLCGRLLQDLPAEMRIALRYAGGTVQDHVLSVLSQKEREVFDDELELFTNLREIDVKTAQQKVLEKAASYGP